MNKFEPNPSELEEQNNEGAPLDRCRLENILDNPDLPILGDPDLKASSVENFVCYFNMRHEIETNIIKEYEINEQNRYKMLQELME